MHLSSVQRPVPGGIAVFGTLALILAAAFAPAPGQFLFWLAIPLYASARALLDGQLRAASGREIAARWLLASALTLMAGVPCQLLLSRLLPSVLAPDRLYPVIGLAALVVGLCVAQWRSWPYLGLLFLSRLQSSSGPQTLYTRLNERARELTLRADAFWPGGALVALANLLLLSVPLLLAMMGKALGPLTSALLQLIVLMALVEAILRLTDRARQRPQPVSTGLSFLLDGAVPLGNAITDPDSGAVPPEVIGPQQDLLLAARRGDAAGVKLAIAHGADPNAPPPPESADQRSPLIAAATAVEPGALRALIAAGARVDGVSGGLTALLAATRDSFDGRISAVLTLLANGADPNLADDAGNTPLHFAASTRDAAVIQSLLDVGARIDAANREGMTALALACEAGNYVVVDFLIKHGAQSDVEGTTPALLFAAAVDGDDARGVKRLLKARAKVDARGPHGRSALMVAALADNAEIAEALLAAGAQVNACDEAGTSALLEAARAGANRVLRRLVFHKPDAAGRDSRARSALHLAARAGSADPESVRLLLALGCDPAALDADGRTAAEHAAAAGRWPLVRELDPDYPIPRAHQVDEEDAAEDLGQIEPDPPGRLLVRAAMQGRFPLFQELLAIPGIGVADIAEALNAAHPHLDRRYAEAVIEAGFDAFERTLQGDSLWERLCGSKPAPLLVLEVLIERTERSPGANAVLLPGLCHCELDVDSEPQWVALRERALAIGAHVNAQDSAGRPVLLIAARSLPMPWIERLIDAGADPNVRDARAESVLTQLAWAQRADAREIAPLLIRAGADPALAARDGSTPAGIARLTGQMELAALLEWPTGAHPGQKLDGASLAEAGRRGDLATLDRLLGLGLDINGSDAQGATALLHAAGTGQLELVRALLDRGADPKRSSAREISPAAAAILAGRQDVLELLVSRGLDLEAPLLGRLTALGLAAACLRAGLVDWLLRRGADVEGNRAPESPLETVLALVFDGTRPLQPIQAMLERLLESGANPDRPDSVGNTALLRLLAAGRPEPLLRDETRFKPILLALVNAGANPNATDRVGRSALHWACRHGLVVCGGALLELGADPRIADDARQLPIDLLSPRYRIHLGPALRQAAEAWNRQRGPRRGS